MSELETVTFGGTLSTATVICLCMREQGLASGVRYLRDLFVLRLPPSKLGAMALELLSLHAPLGVLPGL